jgi:hypothetical protein
MTNGANDFEDDETAKNYNKTMEAIEKSTYWFHDIEVNHQAKQFKIAKNMNPCVIGIVILIVLVISYRICPGFLQSLIDILPSVIEALRSNRDNITPLNKRDF